MNTIDFINELNNISLAQSEISAVYYKFLYNFNEEIENETQFKNEVRNKIKNIKSEEFTAFISKLNACEEIGNSFLKTFENDEHLETAEKIQKLFSLLKAWYNELATEKYKNKSSDNVETMLSQHELSLKEINDKIKFLNQSIEDANKSINDKSFSLLINTVAVLGIFVAVAFAGFGANTIFSSVKFDISENIYTNTFYLSLTAFLSYNLLFLLFYCIFKIIERFSPSTKVNLWQNCWAFIIIDIIMLAIVIWLFMIVR